MKRLVAILLLLAPPAFGQALDTPTVQNTYDAATLDDLPTTDNVFSFLETAEPSINTDRFAGAGLYVGQPARVGSFFSSWTQTLYKVGDADVTDPSGSGAPLLLPDLNWWQRMSVVTGLMTIDVAAPGLAVILEPRRPTDRWTRTVSVSQFGWKTGASSAIPSIVTLDGWSRVSAMGSGPLLADGQGTNRLSGTFAGSWTRGTQLYRAESAAPEGSMASAYAQLLFTPSARTEVQTTAWVQQVSYPPEHRVPFGRSLPNTDDSATHLQASWDRHPTGARRLRAFANYTRRDRTPEHSTTDPVVFERLRDGPLSALAFLATGTVNRWSTGIRMMPATADSAGGSGLQAGIEFGGSRQRSSSFYSGLAGETVDGIAARVWRFTAPGIDSLRRQTNLTAYVAERRSIGSHLTVDAGLRVDTASGSAEGAERGVGWTSLLPRAALQWTMGTARVSTIFVGVRRAAFQLPLDLLAMGDPAAPSSEIFRWAAAGPASQPLPLGPLVARAGPGGSPDLVSIDADLKRPLTDEFAIGLDSQISRVFRLRVVGFARRERDLIGLVNVGVPLSAYSVVQVPDRFVDEARFEDDRLLSIYDRQPESFGDDRYILTNPEQEAATSESLEISGELRTARFTLSGGATASRANGPAANRGYGPTENDQSIVGELFTNPNAETYRQGRLFTDRAYTIKLSAIWRLPADFRLGVIARYQDGQPFSRLTVLPGLNQGAEAVRSFPNAGARLMFTETVDVRLQKWFGGAGRRAAVILDAFNVLNTSNEVEERVVTGNDYRTVTAIQPPRTFHVGLRVAF